MNIAIAGGSILGDIFIEASPETVFEALTSPAELEQWWGAEGMYRTRDWIVDLRPGGERSCQAIGADGKKGSVTGVHLEIDCPRLLAHTWNPSWEAGLPETVVRFSLTAVPGGTLLKIEHTGFDAAHETSQTGHQQGWMRVLGWLGDYVKTKELAQ